MSPDDRLKVFSGCRDADLAAQQAASTLMVGFGSMLCDKSAGLPFAVHPHMLRHACGVKLANDGHDTRALQRHLGHKNLVHAERYKELAPDRFKDSWRNQMLLV